MPVTTLVPWFGGNRLLAPHVGEALQGCSWVGIPFAGGMSELPHITARTILVNDKHRHVINLARVAAHDTLRPLLLHRLKLKAFHPDELVEAQAICKANEPPSLDVKAGQPEARLDLAEAYFVSCWMGRSGKSGQKDEFTGRPALRWNASGGDSVVRYHSAIRGLATFRRTLRRCTFETMDAFDFLERCEDTEGSGIYADPPFFETGRIYVHNAGQTTKEEMVWHTRLRDALERFQKTRVVIRFYDHLAVRGLYSERFWHYGRLAGGKNQANKAAPELLLTNLAARGGDGLF